MHYLKNKNSDTYFEKILFDINGYIDINLFIKTWEIIVQNNEMLRTEIVWENIKSPIQIIHKNNDVNIEIYYEKDNVRFENINLNVNLYDVPFKIVMYKYLEQKYRIAICSHHLLFDGWSTSIILREFISIYNNLINNREPSIQEKGRYREYIKKIVNRTNEEEVKKFWCDYLKEFNFQNTNYFVSRNRNNLSTQIDNYSFILPSESEINKFIKQNQITLAEYVFTAWSLLIYKYTGQKDILFGTTVSGRKECIKNIDNIVGLFINTIPFRKKIDSKSSIHQTLIETKYNLINREKYELTSLTDIGKYCNTNDLFFSSIVVIENYPFRKSDIMKQSTFEITPLEQKVKGEYDLIVNVSVIDKVIITISYNKDTINTEDIYEIADYFMKILEEMKSEYNKTIEDIKVDFNKDSTDINEMINDLDKLIDNFDFD